MRTACVLEATTSPPCSWRRCLAPGPTARGSSGRRRACCGRPIALWEPLHAGEPALAFARLPRLPPQEGAPAGAAAAGGQSGGGRAACVCAHSPPDDTPPRHLLQILAGAAANAVGNLIYAFTMLADGWYLMLISRQASGGLPMRTSGGGGGASAQQRGRPEPSWLPRVAITSLLLLQAGGRRGGGHPGDRLQLHHADDDRRAAPGGARPVPNHAEHCTDVRAFRRLPLLGAA